MSAPRFIGFDIETAPVPEMVDRFAKAFPDFDERQVKYGNAKDPVKRAAILENAKVDHEIERSEYWANLKEKAALDPFFGRIVCIGLIEENGEPEILSGATEAETLRLFWARFSDNRNAMTKFVFWTGSGDYHKLFDLDYIVTRSRILQVWMPGIVRQRGRYSERFVDLATEFLLGNREKYLSLTKAADMFGLYDRPGSKLTRKTEADLVQGKDFWQFWEGCANSTLTQESQSILAQKYLNNDTLHLQAIAPIVLGLR